MSIKAVLFDLDGTLLPMDQEQFVTEYFIRLAKRLAPLGYETRKLKKVFWDGVGAMVQNDGSCSNEERFWGVFEAAYGKASVKDRPVIEDFYKNEFNEVKKVCGYKKEAREIVEFVIKKEKLAVLATNPLFPHIATENRMRWAGLEPELFAAYTTYEDCHYCKPNPKYYRELLSKLGLEPEECIMVGNDLDEDILPTEKLGMQNFLLTDCLINKRGQENSNYPQGDFEALKKYLEENL